MALFQKSVQKKFINALDKAKVEAAYQRLLAHFGNPVIQQNIRLAKEEQYQEGFLNQLFVEILGYRMSPQPFFNLITEQKNEKNSKKADGAILKNDKPIAVIELKSLKTVDLQSIELQAFSYKNNQSQCVYVITSNFQKVRFYIENAIDWEEFDLFNLSKERFQLLYLCLQAEHLLTDLPLRVKKDSVQKEEDITKQLYNDYASFKKALFKDILSKDKNLNPLILFKKTQKLLDRFLFIFFAEDKGLLQPNTVRSIVNQWNTLKDLDAYQPLYNRFKQYFGYLNHGHQTPQYSIFAYNGGLFSPDAFLDNLTISDGLLYNYTQLLSGYDFETDVDTNILGHIFEHSLNETDEIAASATNATIDKSKTKRKKDGIFYTPRYITKYIVENTVGALCQRKLEELGIDPNNIDIHADNETKNTVCKKIHLYRDWLLNLSILDPACGSGAFLNQALTFLMEEHQRIDAMFKSLYEVPISLTDNVIQILENNIFGVDINEESVEIARLSLWLRTAKVGRKLNDLSRKVLCGNSLISDPDVAGDFAFDWQKAFPQVFEKGGFDVVIGNPPYVRQELLGDFKPYLSKNYQVYASSSDLFAYFYERSIQILKQNGYLGFISNTFDKTTASQPLRTFLQQQTSWCVYADFTSTQVFEGAITYPIILIAQNHLNTNNNFSYIKIMPEAVDNPTHSVHLVQTIVQANMNAESWSFQSNTGNILIQKMLKHETIKQQFGKCYYGIKTGLNEAFILTDAEKAAILKSNPQSAELIKAFYEGKDLKKWSTPKPTQQLILFPSKWTKQQFGAEITEVEALNSLKNNHKLLISKLLPFEELAKKRYDKGDFWWELRNCAYYNLFEKSKIVFPNLQHTNKFAIDDKGCMINAPSVLLPTDDKALLAVLNSKVVWYFLNTICVVRSGGYIEVKPQYFEQIPIPSLTDSNKTMLSKLSEQVIEMTIQQQAIHKDCLDLFLNNFIGLKINKAIENWHQGDFGAFKKVLEKQKIEIPLKKQKEWRELFETEKT
ncbi:MAG: hypothetical protein RIS64_3525, partial [Bacteroidota bacterium]